MQDQLSERHLSARQNVQHGVGRFPTARSWRHEPPRCVGPNSRIALDQFFRRQPAEDRHDRGVRNFEAEAVEHLSWSE